MVSVLEGFGGSPREVVPSAMVRHATAVVVEMPGLASTRRAAAGITKATVWTAFRTLVTDMPRLTSVSASKPALMDPIAITCSNPWHPMICTQICFTI